MFTKYYTGWHRDLVRPASPEDFKKLFDKMHSDKPTKNWEVKCLREGLPFNMGSKAETFCLEDLNDSVVIPILELFREAGVPLILETKTHYVGLERYMDVLKDLDCAVIVAIMGGSDTLNYKLEPGVPMASARWYLVEQLNKRGIWTGVRWEPVMATINDKQAMFEQYAEMCVRTGAKHASIFNYRTSLPRRGQEEFEKRGINYIRMLEGNLDEKWRPKGQALIQALKDRGVKVSSPDFVNFPFGNACESCCGVDGLFKPYQFTFQHACKRIEEEGSVCWDDMEEITFREPKAYERMKEHWNGGGQYYYWTTAPRSRCWTGTSRA